MGLVYSPIHYIFRSFERGSMYVNRTYVGCLGMLGVRGEAKRW